jgi:hypothetical protein
LLGRSGDSQRYFYRVTNLHASGEGARSTWEQGQGSGALTITSARAKVDF